ncbi:MAG: hypothetical protein ACRELC_08120 [Gemmatimonadota bacterium]
MSIVGFHRFLIAMAILFCALFAAWEYVSFARGAGWASLALGVAFTVAGAGLVYYLANLDRFLDRERSR